jgi:hypothetical protein
MLSISLTASHLSLQLFTTITEEYDRARDLLRGAIDDFDRKRLPSDKLRSLLKHLETKL